MLASWNDTATKQAIVDYATRIAEAVPVEERIATFDNDGTLWCEKPMPIELAFILRRLDAMVNDDSSLRGTQPWKAAHEKDYKWLSDVITKHYGGDDSDVKVLMGGILRAFAGMSVDEYEAQSGAFIRTTEHPTNGRLFFDCAYQPMIELLRYLEANGFTTLIASGGDRDFMRSIASEVYGIAPERVVGSSNALQYDEASCTLKYLAQPDVFDDGPVKPVRIWSRVGRRPLVAGGNSNGDIPMLCFAGGGHPALRLLLLHDDAEREFDYTTGAEQALQQASDDGWTVVSLKNDWSTIFVDAS